MNTKPVAGEAVPNCDDLEPTIMDALRMVSIACIIADSAIGGAPHESMGKAGTGLYLLTGDQRENVLFAVYQTKRLIETIKSTWEKIQ